MKNKTFGFDESGEGFIQPSDRISARSLNRPLVNIYEDLETESEKLKIINNALLKVSKSKIVNGYLQNLSDGFATGNGLARIPLGIAYTPNGVYINKPNFENFEIALAKYIDLNLNDQGNDITVEYNTNSEIDKYYTITITYYSYGSSVVNKKTYYVNNEIELFNGTTVGDDIQNSIDYDFYHTGDKPYCLEEYITLPTATSYYYFENNKLVSSTTQPDDYIFSISVSGSTYTYSVHATEINEDTPDLGVVSAESFKAVSARDKKTNIAPTNHSAVNEINMIKIVDFNFKDDLNTPKVGFIADDTDEIFSTPKHDSMDIYNCVGMLLKAVQELSEENKNLKKQIEELK